MTTEKFCTRCGKKFQAVGREVICPSCKQAAAEENKRAAVLKAKKASWDGESVPVRVSGRASTVIRRYGVANSLPFAAALDALLRASDFFQSSYTAWEDVTPYKSHRRDKHATETAQEAQESPQGKQDAPQDGAQTAQGKPQASKPQDVTSKPQDGALAAQGKQDAPQEVQAAKTVKTVKTTKKAVKTVKAAAGK